MHSYMQGLQIAGDVYRVDQLAGMEPLRLLLLTARKERADMEPFVPHTDGRDPGPQWCQPQHM